MRRGPSGFVVSLLLHIVACALLYLGLKQPHTVDSRLLSQRYAVRVMELHKQEPRPQRYIQPPPLNSLPQPNTQPLASSGSPENAAAARIPPNFIPQKQAVQTLIQPDAPHDLLIPRETPLPQVFVWSAPTPAVKKIVQPAPQTVVKVDVRPSIEQPNQETRISDIKVSSTVYDAKTPMPMPSNTSPVTAQNPQKTQQIPQTASKTTGQPTPASVISASNIQLQEGTVTLPMINEVAPAPFTGSLSPGESRTLSQTGRGKTEGKENSAGAGQSSGNQTGNAPAAAAGASQQGGGTGQAGGEASVTSGGAQRTIVHITLPKDGRFGMVVVGSSLADDYPETVNLWTGRLAYTVYLHIGVTKNWILQYSLPKLQGAPPASSTRPEAPYPYDITRPSIDADLNADAIMVHGFVNSAGRFEQLAVVFPTELAEAKFLLRALQQWQFRPALQNGQATPVEVLIIIPDQTE